MWAQIWFLSQQLYMTTNLEQQRILSTAQKLKGYLYKKSSQFLVGWQKRFWLIDGSQFAYYQDEALAERKDSFEISEITDIERQSSKEFCFTYKGRRYQLKAEDTATRDDWVKSLRMLNRHFASPVANRLSRAPSTMRSQSEARNNSGKLDALKTTKSISSDRQLSDYSLMMLIGLERVAKEIDSQRVSSRIVFGSFKQGYYFLVSCKSLSQTYEDDEILPVEYVRPFDFNVLYRIRAGEDTVKEVAKASLINQIKIKGNNQLVVNYGMEISLFSQMEVNRFHQRLTKAVMFGKEYHNDKGITLKRNIDSFVKRYDEHKGLIERRQKVKMAFQSYFVRLSSKNQLKLPSNYQTLQTYVHFLSQDLVQFVSACLVKPIPRVDLLQQYSSFIHSKVYCCLHSYWNLAHMNMPTEQLLKLCQLCNNYSEMINKYLQDTRMSSGPAILASIYFRKALAEMDGEIELVREQVLATGVELRAEEEGVLGNGFAREYCKIVERALKKMLGYGHSEQILTECCTFINSSFHLWINKMIQVVQNSNDTKLILSFCNETQTYKTFVFGVFENIIIAKGLVVSTYLKLIENDRINQMLMDLHHIAIRRLFMIMFSTINVKVLTTKFMEVDIDVLSKEVLARLDGLESVRRSAFHDIELEAVQEIVSYYVSTLARVSPASKISIETLVKKINVDRSKIEEIFKTIINPAEMTAMIEQLIVTIEFLNADSVVTIRKICSSFVALPRNTFNLRLAKSLIELKYTLSKEDQSELYRICEDIFTQAPEQRTKSQYKTQMFEPVSKESFLDNWAASGRRSTITKSLADKQFIQMALVDSPPKASNNLSIQGYLQKKKVSSSGKSKMFYQQRYFKLTPKHLQWYLDKDSKQIQNCLSLTDIKKVNMHHSKDYQFLIEVADVKYKFLADNVQECKRWVESIQKAMHELEKVEVKTFVVTQENDLFVDYFKKPTLKQSEDDYNMKMRRESVLSTLSSPGKSMIKQITPSKDTKAGIFDQKSSVASQSPVRKRAVEQPKPSLSPQKPSKKTPVVQAEPSRGCWFGFSRCMKFG